MRVATLPTRAFLRGVRPGFSRLTVEGLPLATPAARRRPVISVSSPAPKAGSFTPPRAVEDNEPTYASGNLSGYKTFRTNGTFALSTGAELPELQVAYETWGELNATRSNAILLHCGMSASSHACSHPGNPSPGWWEDFIGPGKAVDTRLFYVICTNNLGGCYGTTGPSSTDPRTGKPYGSSFPRFMVYDQVAAQMTLLSHLGIDRLHASVGASLGGMQSVCAAGRFPDRVGKFITISACAKSFPGSIAFRHAQRTAIKADPHWNGGDYYGGELPAAGLRLAREIGTITYRSGQEWRDRFGQGRLSEELPKEGMDNEFQIEGYLAHQGKKWVNNYDPNSMLWISKAMDSFTMEMPHPDHGRQCLATGLQGAKQPGLVIGVQHDVLFPVWQQKEIADKLREAGNDHVIYYELDSTYGHDTFLLNQVSIGPAVKGHLEQEPNGAKHLWEEKAAIVHNILQSVRETTGLPDTMRSVFRGLARGQDTVCRRRLLDAAKLIFAQDDASKVRIERVFEERLPSPQIAMAEFVSLRAELQGGEDAYLP